MSILHVSTFEKYVPFHIASYMERDIFPKSTSLIVTSI